jgi:hypothetical protein
VQPELHSIRWRGGGRQGQRKSQPASPESRFRSLFVRPRAVSLPDRERAQEPLQLAEVQTVAPPYLVIKRPILPRVKLVLGANKNLVLWAERDMAYEMGPLSVRTGCCHAGLCRSPDRGPQNRIDQASRELGRFNRGNRTTCKIAGGLATAEGVASSRPT